MRATAYLPYPLDNWPEKHSIKPCMALRSLAMNPTSIHERFVLPSTDWHEWPLARLVMNPGKIQQRFVLPSLVKFTSIDLHDLAKTWHESWQDSWEIGLTTSCQIHQYWLAWPWQDLAWILARFMRDRSCHVLSNSPVPTCMTLARLGMNHGKNLAWRTLGKVSYHVLQTHARLFQDLVRHF